MPIHRYYLADFVSIQRQSFFDLLEKGLIEEFAKRNPITSLKKDFEFFFYPEYYRLTQPEYSPYEAIVKNKSYTSQLFIPVQLTDKKNKKILLNWVYIGNIPLMTKRGHFILNGAARVIVNQILRSPGIYYQQKIYENYDEKWSQKPEDTFKRYYADLICMRGTWLRIEMDKEKKIWAQMKKGPKIPIFCFLLAMGVSEKRILKTIKDSYKLLGNINNSIKNPPEAWKEISKLMNSRKSSGRGSTAAQPWGAAKLVGAEPPKPLGEALRGALLPKPPARDPLPVGAKSPRNPLGFTLKGAELPKTLTARDCLNSHVGPLAPKPPGQISSPLGSFAPVNPGSSAATPPEGPFGAAPKGQGVRGAELPTTQGGGSGGALYKYKVGASGWAKGGLGQKKEEKQTRLYSSSEEGRKWLYNRFLNPRSYDLGKQGRLTFNRKLGLNISSTQLTLTGLDVLYATDYLIKVEKGLLKIDDIDHLKNRRVRTSGELIQIQIGIGLVRLEKTIREALNKASILRLTQEKDKPVGSKAPLTPPVGPLAHKPLPPPFAPLGLPLRGRGFRGAKLPNARQISSPAGKGKDSWGAPAPISPQPAMSSLDESFTISNFMNHKAFNSAIREFFGTSPLSQFMDQINPLAELTHKRRLSSMGPGGVTRDTATLAIRGIHPTHYGRICPIETPEGKNTGLVNSITTYARVNSNGIIESPFYKVYKGQVQKNTGMLFFSAEQEEKVKLAAADLSISSIGFLPKSLIPVRIAEDFTKIERSQVQFIGVSPLQMISIAASLIPFLEHDDANRALMGSNMQRQAVPLIRPERPLVGTGLEARAVSDSGHTLISKLSGFVTYVSAQKIIIYSKIQK